MSKFINRIDNDDEVEVLGFDLVAETRPAEKPGGGRKRLIVAVAAVAVAVALMIVLAYMLGRSSEKPELAQASYMAIDETQIEQNVAASAARPKLLHAMTDTINDLAMTLVSLDGYRASVAFDIDDNEDVLLATPAADYRADNGDIVGEFIIDNKQLARGVRKDGWCYVDNDGRISIGAGKADDVKRRALDEGGCFFRQFALVMDGQICPNMLKGKYKRRALGFLDGVPVLVKTLGSESVYDFSQALADYGFSHAIYLPGGAGDWVLRSDTGEEVSRCSRPDGVKVSFLIVR